MTAPGRSGAEQATIRGLIVLFVAVVIGIGLLSKANGLVGSTDSSTDKPKTTTTTTTASSTPQSTEVPVNTGNNTVPAGAHTPADVKVAVVNSTSGVPKVGSKNGGLLTTAGFNVVAIKNGPAADATTVYFKAGFQADAEAVKNAVKVPTALVAAAPATPIVPEAKDADVTVVFGKDYKG